MRSALSYLLAAFLTAAPSAQASWPISPSEQARAFAMCAGLYSAQTEHQRQFHGMVSADASARAALFSSMLEAVLPDAVDYGLPATQAVTWQVQAKAGHAKLLSASVFGMIPERARPARAAARRDLEACDRLVFGS